MPTFTATVTKSVVCFAFAFTFRPSWFRAVADVVIQVTTVMASSFSSFAFAFNEVELSTVLDELSFNWPAFFIYRPAAFV